MKNNHSHGQSSLQKGTASHNFPTSPEIEPLTSLDLEIYSETHQDSGGREKTEKAANIRHKDWVIARNEKVVDEIWAAMESGRSKAEKESLTQSKMLMIEGPKATALPLRTDPCEQRGSTFGRPGSARTPLEQEAANALDEAIKRKMEVNSQYPSSWQACRPQHPPTFTTGDPNEQRPTVPGPENVESFNGEPTRFAGPPTFETSYPPLAYSTASDNRVPAMTPSFGGFAGTPSFHYMGYGYRPVAHPMAPSFQVMGYGYPPWSYPMVPMPPPVVLFAHPGYSGPDYQAHQSRTVVKKGQKQAQKRQKNRGQKRAKGPPESRGK